MSSQATTRNLKFATFKFS